MPSLKMDTNWVVSLRGEPLGRIKCINGDVLRAECLLHTRTLANDSKCKLLLEVRGEFEACQCFCMKWFYHGRHFPSTDHDGHRVSTNAIVRMWRTMLGD